MPVYYLFSNNVKIVTYLNGVTRETHRNGMFEMNLMKKNMKPVFVYR
jgi:hypothetical protein